MLWYKIGDTMYCDVRTAQLPWNVQNCDLIGSLQLKLTLNMLNCFKDYKRYIHISYHIFEFVQQKKTNFTMEQRYKLPVLHWQYHACWCAGDFRSQGINRYSVDPWSWNIPSPASEELRWKGFSQDFNNVQELIDAWYSFWSFTLHQPCSAA